MIPLLRKPFLTVLKSWTEYALQGRVGGNVLWTAGRSERHVEEDWRGN